MKKLLLILFISFVFSCDNSKLKNKTNKSDELIFLNGWKKGYLYALDMFEKIGNPLNINWELKMKQDCEELMNEIK